MIELSDFISKSLVQIARGIEKANIELADSKAIVSPECAADQHGRMYLSDTSAENVERIDFDVAVAATESESNKASGGISVAVIGGGMTGTSEATSRHESRIKFSVPMLLPQSPIHKTPKPATP